MTEYWLVNPDPWHVPDEYSYLVTVLERDTNGRVSRISTSYPLEQSIVDDLNLFDATGNIRPGVHPVNALLDLTVVRLG